MLLALHKTSELCLSETRPSLGTLGVVTVRSKCILLKTTNAVLNDSGTRAGCKFDIGDVVIVVYTLCNASDAFDPRVCRQLSRRPWPWTGYRWTGSAIQQLHLPRSRANVTSPTQRTPLISFTYTEDFVVYFLVVEQFIGKQTVRKRYIDLLLN